MKLFTKPLTEPLTEPLKDGGFTFIELIMVIVILGILAAYAGPKFTSTSDFSVAGAAEVVASDITYTQREAMSTRQSLALDLTATQASAYNYAYDGATATGKPRDLADFNSSLSVSITSITPTGATIRFNSLGEPVGMTAQATITVSDGNVSYNITIEPYTGKVTITRI